MTGTLMWCVACAGDVPTLEALAAVSILRDRLPDLKMRFINVVDLMRLQDNTEHPHGLSHRDFDTLFTTDVPVIFAFHGYPWLVHRLTYRRTNHRNIHVRGYKEEGTTSTPFDMVMMNDLDRFHLVIDVIDHVPSLRSTQLCCDRKWSMRGPQRAATPGNTATTFHRSATGPGPKRLANRQAWKYNRQAWEIRVSQTIADTARLSTVRDAPFGRCHGDPLAPRPMNVAVINPRSITPAQLMDARCEMRDQSPLRRDLRHWVGHPSRPTICLREVHDSQEVSSCLMSQRHRTNNPRSRPARSDEADRTG